MNANFLALIKTKAIQAHRPEKKRPSTAVSAKPAVAASSSVAALPGGGQPVTAVPTTLKRKKPTDDAVVRSAVVMLYVRGRLSSVHHTTVVANFLF
jgi:hypothetical protein